MYGAILGDIIGSVYEFDRSPKVKEFLLFSRGSEYTDDSVMTIAVADALMQTRDSGSVKEKEILGRIGTSMKKWGRKYPYAGYGTRFELWLKGETSPYGSYGNGSVMRVSSTGWLYETLEETRRIARLTAESTHNHPEGINDAETTASAIFLARIGTAKEEIRKYIVREFNYDLTRTCDEIRLVTAMSSPARKPFRKQSRRSSKGILSRMLSVQQYLLAAIATH